MLKNLIRRYYDDVATIYAKKYGWEFMDKEVLNLFIKSLNQAKISNLVDLGSDPGKVDKFFAENGFRVTAIDISKSMIFVAKNDFSHPNVKYICGDLVKWIATRKKRLKRGLFLLFALIHNDYSEQKRILKAIKKVCLPGSQVLLSVQIGEEEEEESPILRTKIPIYGWNETSLKKMLHSLGYKIAFSFTRSPWETELQRDKLFLILEVTK